MSSQPTVASPRNRSATAQSSPDPRLTGSHHALVRTARPLDDDQAQALLALLKRRYGDAVDMVQEIAPEVLGGVWLRVDDTIIDGGIQGRTELLRRHLCAQCRVILSSGFPADSVPLCLTLDETGGR